MNLQNLLQSVKKQKNAWGMALIVVSLSLGLALTAYIAQQKQNTLSKAAEGDVVRLIDVGSNESYVDSQGRTWEPDSGYVDPAGGTVTRTAAVTGTQDPKIYQTERYYLRGYSLPVANGNYTVKLHFNEAHRTAAGERVMGIKVEKTVVPRLDVFAKAGGNTAYVETIPNVAVKDGKLDIRFTHFTQEVAMLDGIEVLQGTAPAATCVDTNTCGTVDVKALVENAIAAGQSSVKIPPGTHRISSPINVKNGKGIVIDGTDATVVMTTRGSVFNITDSGATLKGMTIDYDPLPFTQGTVTSVDAANRTIQVRLHDGYPDGSWFTDSTYERAGFTFDPTTHEWRTKWVTFGSLTTSSDGRTITLSTVNNINGTWPPGSPYPVAVGQHMAIVKRTFDPAILFVNGNGLVVLDQVTVRSAPGLAIYSQHWDGGSRLEWVTIERGPRPAGATQDRVMSANMDALRFVLNRKGPEVHGADIGWNGDDGNNWQGYPFHVTQKESDTSFTISPSPSWVKLANIYRPGDTFRLMDANATVKATAPIQSVTAITGGFRVTLQSPISVTSSSTDIVDVPEINSPNGILRNSHFHDHFAVGMRVQADNTLIQGNLFENDEAAVLIAGQYTDWFESGWSKGVWVTRNVMRKAERGIDVSAAKGVSSGHKDITILDNRIENMSQYGIYLSTVDHPVVKNNTIASAANPLFVGNYVINQDIANNGSPTNTPVPTAIPTNTPMPNPTATPTSIPTNTSIPQPTNTPIPTATPTTPPTTTGNGLQGSYFTNKYLSGSPALIRIDPFVNFSWSTGSPASSIPNNNFSVRWTGYVVPKYSQTYTFYTLSDDGVRLWVNGVQIINNWTNHASKQNSGSITLTAGRKYSIQMDYYENTGNAVAGLFWSSPSQAKQVIPQSQLYAN